MLGIPYEYLTSDLPGVGGEIKQADEDFRVEEVPLYLPSGSGEHTYFEIEKVGVATMAAIDAIARKLGVPARSIGYAGLKDRKGITRQTLSVAAVDPEQVSQLQLRGIEVLRVSRHTNKLRLGHLLGNRFKIRVRNVSEDAESRLRDLLPRLVWIPNFFGPQRFGSRGVAHFIGRSLLQGDHQAAVERILGDPTSTEGDPAVVQAREHFMAGDWERAHQTFPIQYRDELAVLHYLRQAGPNYSRAVKRLREHSRRMYYCAFQSYLFNLILAERMRQTAGDLTRLFPGDLAFLHHNGAVFIVEDPEKEQARVDRLEISPSGPLFGRKMPFPTGRAAAIESAVLKREGLELDEIRRLVPTRFFQGVRRPLRVPVQDFAWRLENADLLLEFFLPRGAFATTLVREITKNEVVPKEYYQNGERERHLLWQHSDASLMS